MNRNYPAVVGKQTVVLSGWYGYGNAGDEAILQQFLVETEPWARTRVLTGPADKITANYGQHGAEGLGHPDWRIHRGKVGEGLRNLIRYLRALLQCDLVVVGGGGLLRDNTTWPNFFHVIDEIWLGKLLRKKTALYAIGVGPFETSLGRILIRETVKRCDLITVRDHTSKALLEQIGVSGSRVTVVADPALLLEPQPVKDPHMRRVLEELASKPNAVGLYVRSVPRLLEIAPQLDALHRETGMTFVAIPLCCCPGLDDRIAGRELRQAMQYPDALHVWEASLTAPEIKHVTGTFGMNIALCLHALIFSLSMGVPAVALNYEPKVANVAQTLGISQYVVNFDHEFPTSLHAVVLECRARDSEYRNRLQLALDRERAKAKQTFDYLRALAGVPA